jgi:valyl-tRNA synthetase
MLPPSTYNPAETEVKWYARWMEKGFFKARVNPDKEPYCIVMPPPNVTGVLHMGHMLNNTIQDVLIRRARMQGKETCWVPGTDHASIATEARVVAMLRERGIRKSDLTREEFLRYAWEWKEKYGGIILEQLKKLGASCDWDRTCFTMDPHYYEAVLDVFVDLYNKGYIYRGLRMINWDPVGKTALSDDEVFYRDVPSRLYYIRYPIEGSNEYITIATVRPETIMADTAVCIHPDDPRYRHLKGKRAIIPLINRTIPVIEDEYVSMEFGTGCLKITPAHDANDYELGLKHNLPVIDILNDDGTLNERAVIFVGEDRFTARKKIAEELEKQGFLVKAEDYTSSVGFSERTDAIIEPRLSMQWFVKMKALTGPALEHVMNDSIRLIPPKFKNTYRHWMENVRDWCISRQLWWGHRIPAWYNEKGEFVVAKTEAEARDLFRSKNIPFAELRQDEDVLDTWFSSWLWPIAVFDSSVFKDGNKGNADLNYFYPTHDLVTAPEILFFWVARMIMAGYAYRGDKPFRNVYLTGIVRDKVGRKMSKSLGNSPDPLELIARYGADGVRTGMLFSSPAGNDLLFDEKLCEQGRNFANKIWNAYRLVNGWQPADTAQPEANEVACTWFASRFNQAVDEVDDLFEKFRISDALKTIYSLIWEDFCSWFLEIIKPEYGKPIDRLTYEQTLIFFEKLLQLLHPFMPFITEELWHALRQRGEDDYLIVSAWPQGGPSDEKILNQARFAFQVISEIRNLRNTRGIPPRRPLKLYTGSNSELPAGYFQSVIRKLAHVEEIVAGKPVEGHCAPLLVGTTEFFIPLDQQLNREAERASLQKELEYQRGFLESVNRKLSNERFVTSAPASVVENERKKKADAEARIRALEAQLAQL